MTTDTDKLETAINSCENETQLAGLLSTINFQDKTPEYALDVLQKMNTHLAAQRSGQTECPMGDNCDLTTAYMCGVEAGKKSQAAQRQGGHAVEALYTLGDSSSLPDDVRNTLERTIRQALAHPPAVTGDVHDINVADMVQTVDNAGGHTAVTGDRAAALEWLNGASAKYEYDNFLKHPDVFKHLQTIRAALQSAAPTSQEGGVSVPGEVINDVAEAVAQIIDTSRDWKYGMAWTVSRYADDLISIEAMATEALQSLEPYRSGADDGKGGV